MAILTVTTANDTVNATDGVMSLREAIAAANALDGADTIQFHNTLDGSAIFLQEGALQLSGELTIDGDVDGDDAADITISGDVGNDGQDAGDSRVFEMSGGTSTLDALIITGGYSSDYGGGIFQSAGDLTVQNSKIVGNYASDGGGGASTSGGVLSISSSTISGNTGESGGGINIAGESATIKNSTISANSGVYGGGMYIGEDSYAYVGNTTVANNTVGAGGVGGGINAHSELNLRSTTISGNYGGDSAGVASYYRASTLNTIISANGGGGGNFVRKEGAAGFGNHLIDVAAADIFETIVTNEHGVTTGLLTDNGGPVETMAIASGGDAHNQGSTYFPFVTDARGTGFDRVSGGTLDIGAFEVQELPADDPVTITVTTLDDVMDNNDGVTSLREAIEAAKALGGDDIIEFDASLSGGRIDLIEGQLTTTGNLTINGDVDHDGSADVTISGSTFGRVFLITSGNATLNGLHLTDGLAISGGAIFNAGTLNVLNSTIANSESTGGAYSGGGGIYNTGTLTVANSLISGNEAAQYGGGVYSRNADSTTLINTTVTGNHAGRNGRGISNGYVAGDTAIFNSTITGNLANGAGSGLERYQGTVTISNSIIAGNYGDETSGLFVDAGNNIIDDFDAIDVSTIFKTIGVNGLGVTTGILADNGGPTMTIAIKSGGLAHNTGDDAELPADTPFDARGNGFDRSEGSSSDIGAFEIQNLTLTGNRKKNVLQGGDGDDELFGLNTARTISSAATAGTCWSAEPSAT